MCSLWTYQAIKPEQQRSTLRLTIYPFTLTSLFPLGKTPPCPLQKYRHISKWLSTPTYTTQPKYTQISRSKSIFSNPHVSGKCPCSFLQCLSWLIFRSAPIIETDNALESVFSTRSPVFAEWFSGKLRIPLGETLQYVHMGYGSLYEKDLFIAVEKGIVVGEQTIDYRGEYNKLSEKKI